MKKHYKGYRRLFLIAGVIILSVIFNNDVTGESAVLQDRVRVPDLHGLTVPQAASALNRVGLYSGQEKTRFVEDTTDMAISVNTIIAQSVEPGTLVEPGTVIDFTVLREVNSTVIYDENDFTLVNESGYQLDLTGIYFTSAGETERVFHAARWASELRADYCAQVWSVRRDGPKGLEACQFIRHFISGVSAMEHFWMAHSGIDQFYVLQNGAERGHCVSASPGVEPIDCTIFLETPATFPLAPYIYLACTVEQCVLYNMDETLWMQPPIVLDDLWDISQFYTHNQGYLAPGQCLQMILSTARNQTPVIACQVVAQRIYEPEESPWQEDYSVYSASDERVRLCPAPSGGQMAVCVLPR